MNKCCHTVYLVDFEQKAELQVTKFKSLLQTKQTVLNYEPSSVLCWSSEIRKAVLSRKKN